MFPWQRNQSVDLQNVSVEWFLYDRDVGFKWSKGNFLHYALRDLAPFVQFNKYENTHGGVSLLVYK